MNTSVKSPWLANTGEITVRTIKDLPGQVFMLGMEPKPEPQQMSFDLTAEKPEIEDNGND